MKPCLYLHPSIHSISICILFLFFFLCIWDYIAYGIHSRRRDCLSNRGNMRIDARRTRTSDSEVNERVQVDREKLREPAIERWATSMDGSAQELHAESRVSYAKVESIASKEDLLARTSLWTRAGVYYLKSRQGLMSLVFTQKRQWDRPSASRPPPRTHRGQQDSMKWI